MFWKPIHILLLDYEKIFEIIFQLYGLDVVLFREAQQILKEHDMIIVYLKAQMEETDFYTMRHTLRKEGIDVEVDFVFILLCVS